MPWWRSRYSNATGTYKTIASKAHSELHCYLIQCKYFSISDETNYVWLGFSHHFYSTGIVLKKQSVDDGACCSGDWQFSCEECEAWDWHLSWRMLLLSSDVETGPLQRRARPLRTRSHHQKGTIWHQHPLGNPKNMGKNIYSFLKRGFFIFQQQ